MAILTYEQQLSADIDWALREGGMHFMEENAVHQSLRRVAARLDQHGIPYAVAGAMALFYHGFRRFTEDVDIIVTADGLRAVHARLEGLGYVPPFRGSKNLRDAENGVRIDFIIAGGYPGDGKPKPITFPDPAEVAVEIRGVRVVNLETLVQLKLASGSAPGRLKDLGDVQQVIRELALPADFADKLDPSVRDLYHRMWDEVRIGMTEPNPNEDRP